jgi:3-oxoadipate enol-lactonase
VKRIMLVLAFSVAAILISVFLQDSDAEVISGMAPVGPGDRDQVYYEFQGSGDPVVLIHGLSLDRRMWDAQFETLAVDHQVIRYDMIGHGLSSGATGSVRSWENLRDLLDFLDVDRAHIVGLSMGAGVAVDFALEFPEMTTSLVAMDGAQAGYSWNSSPGEFLDRLSGYMDISNSQGLRPALEQWIADPLFAPARALPEVNSRLEDIVLEGHTALGTGAAFFLPNIYKYAHPQPQANSRLADIQARTLIVTGELDLPDFHNAGRIMLRRVPGAQSVLVPEAGHMVPMEKPAATSQLLANFFNAVLGDVNLDGEVNGLDVDPFIGVLLNGPYQPEADMNLDAAVNGLDVDPFVAAVVGGTQQIPEPSTLLLCIIALGVVGGWRKWGG